MTSVVTLRNLAELVATKEDVQISLAERLLKSAFHEIDQAVAEGNKVRIHKFGSFKLTERSARMGRNPQTGEPVAIPARKSMTFKQAKAYNEKK